MTEIAVNLFELGMDSDTFVMTDVRTVCINHGEN